MRIPRRLVAEFFGEDAQIRELLAPEDFNGALFVVDAEWGGELVRFLASVSAEGQELTQQSAMSLARPERLIFHSERLMSLAFVFAHRARSALLLGLGGGAMARYVRHAWPDCALTIVERSAEVIDHARRWFGVDEEIIADDADAFLRHTRRHWDVILVDLYDAAGVVSPKEGFWERCIARLAEDGIIAVNWAEFAGNDGGRAEAEKLASLLPHTLYITPSGRRDNLIQFAAASPLPDPDDVDATLPGAARLQRPRSTLSRCRIATHWPR
jgi:predicted O-methyltransferase YrrM